MGTMAGVTSACREHGGETSSSLIILLRTVSEVGRIRTWLQLVGCTLVKTPVVLTSEADRGLRRSDREYRMYGGERLDNQTEEHTGSA